MKKRMYKKPEDFDEDMELDSDNEIREDEDDEKHRRDYE